MANFQLVVLPLLFSIAFLFFALLFFVWLKIKIKKSKRTIKAQKAASLFGYSLMMLGGFALFISIFFLITG
jgi:hypothetical protein